MSEGSSTRKVLLNVAEVAEILRVHPETVRTFARRGELKATKAGKGRTCAYRFTYREVARFLGVEVSDIRG